MSLHQRQNTHRHPSQDKYQFLLSYKTLNRVDNFQDSYTDSTLFSQLRVRVNISYTRKFISKNSTELISL